MNHDPPGTRHSRSHLLTLSRSTTSSSVHSPTPSVLQIHYWHRLRGQLPTTLPTACPRCCTVHPDAHPVHTPLACATRTDKGRPSLRLKAEFPAVGTALRYYKHVPEDEDEDEREEQEDVPPGEMEALGETEKGTDSKFKTDWKSNPRAKSGRRKYEASTKTPLCAPTRVTLPVRLIREEDQAAKWLDRGAL